MSHWRGPTETLTAKKILHVLRDGNIEQLTHGGPIADLLVLSEQAVQKALEGITLRTLVSDSQARTVRVA